MSQLSIVFGFGWTYLRRYWGRLAIGVLLGFFFGVSNASFVWATKTLVDRLKFTDQLVAGTNAPANSVTNVVASNITATNAEAAVATPPQKHKKARRVNQYVNSKIDPWLPRMGRPLDWRQMVGGVLFLPLLVSIRSITNYLSSYCIGWASERMISDMRLDVLSKLSTLSLDFFTRSTTGDLLTRVNTDTASLLRCLRLGAADLVKESISVLSLFVALLWINWKLTMFTMSFVPFCLFPLMVLARKARKAAKGARGGEVMQTSQLVELLGGIRIIKAYHLEKEQIERYRGISRRMIRQGMRGLRAKELATPAIEVISMLGLGVMILFIFKYQIGLSDFVGFMMGTIYFFVPIKKLANVHIMFEQTAPGVQRLVNLLSVQPTVKEPETPVPVRSFQKAIQFDNVTFGYEKRPVLQEFSLTIPRGYKLGIAGPSGSGKSTLVNLLFRFYDPKQGAIRIDGVDLRSMSFADLRGLMALVSQEVILFDQTIAANILCGRRDASMAEVKQAAQAAFAHDFIQQLPKGYDTRIGERGVTLSGGQRQRLAIARAFLRNAPILVLDEATASLDSEAESEVQQALDRISVDRTVICVAHRLSTLANTDQIIVLVDGRLVEQGTFSELLQAKGIFAAMARRQGIK